MPQLVTDPEILRQLNATDAAPAPAAPQPDATPPGVRFQDASPAPSSAAPTTGRQRVTDPALLEQLNAPDPQTPGVRFAPQGQPGANGLVWDKDGGRDPKTGELVMAGKPMTENAPSQGLAAMSSALSGIPIAGPALLSGAQKAGAYVREKLYGEPADQTQSAVQGDVERSQAVYPKTTVAGGIAGGVIGLAPAVAEAPALFGAGPGGLTLGKMAAGAATGSAIGGADAAVRSGGDVSAIEKGALAGGIGGAAGPPLAAIASAAGRGIANGVTRLAEGGTGLARPVAQTLMRAAETDGALGPDGLARIREAGPQGMLADVGPATAGVLDTAIQRGGPGATAARQAVEERAGAANADLTVHLDRALGAPQGLQTTETAIRDGSAAARSAAYDAAYGAPINYTTDAGRALEGMVAQRVPPGIIARANAQMRMDGTPSRQMIQRPDGTLEQMPDVRQIDYITRSLNDVARAGDGQGALGGNTAEGRSHGNLARELRNTLRQAVPEYGQALDTAAQPIQARTALEFGSEVLRTTVPRDVAAETIGQMTAPELTQARQGLRSAIAETMSNITRTATDPNIDARQAMATVKLMSSDAAREKMALLIGDREAGQVSRGLEQALTRATSAQGMRAAISTNSRTAGRLLTDEGVKKATAQPMCSACVLRKPRAVCCRAYSVARQLPLDGSRMLFTATSPGPSPSHAVRQPKGSWRGCWRPTRLRRGRSQSPAASPMER